MTVHPPEVRAHEGVRSYPSVIAGHTHPLKHRLGRFQEGGVVNPDGAVLRDMKLLKHAYSFCSLASLQTYLKMDNNGAPDCRFPHSALQCRPRVDSLGIAKRQVSDTEGGGDEHNPGD